MRYALGGALVGALSVGCGAQVVAPQPPELEARMMSADGVSHGNVSIRVTKSGRAHLIANFNGLPAGVHGVHIHETGKCDPADGFESAGGHLSGGSAHGVGSEGGSHLGDMPNLHVPESGGLEIEYFLSDVVVESGPAPLLDMDGAAIVIHAAADDYESQPSGNAHARIACGVIEKVER